MSIEPSATDSSPVARAPARPARTSRWSVLIIPHGSEAPRELVVTRRALRVLRRGVSTLAIVGAVAGLSTAAMAARHAPTSTPAPVTGANPATVDSLRRVLAELAVRESRIRLLAGLSPLDSAPTARPSTSRDVGELLVRAEHLATSFQEVATSLEAHAERMEAMPSIMPTAGWLTSEFSRGRRHPILHVTRPHEGIDLSAPHGTPIVAPASGTVTRVARESGYGLVLEIDHGNGIVTRFAHMSRADVREGARVTRGQAVAAVGSSGLSTGPHLHYEIRVNGRVVDPLTYVLPGAAIPD